MGQPILWVLHLGYLWLVLGLAAKGVAGLGWLLPPQAALHALTIGAVGTFTTLYAPILVGPRPDGKPG